jgi:hypothetical protein
MRRAAPVPVQFRLLPKINHSDAGGSKIMTRLFLSHTSADKPFVEKLAVDLRKLGVDVWYDNWEIKVGDSIVEKINAALAANDYLVIILSPRAVQSDWVRRELNSSLMRSLSDRSIKVLPVLYEKCAIPPLIADLKYADFTLDYAKGLAALAAALELIDPIPSHILRPKSIVSSNAYSDQFEYRRLFPYSFSNYPECLFTDGKLDVSIIVGSSSREHNDESSIFSASSVETDLLGSQWTFSRQVSPGTVRDSVRVVDLAAFLGFQYAKTTAKPQITWPDNDDCLCMVDVSVSSATFDRNVILVGGADTNVFIPMATIAFRQKFGYSLPIRYFGDDKLYFTCDQIYSEMSDKTYSRLEDSSYMHCGYLLMVANPWCAGKVIIFAVGSRATGTQAAVLALIRGKDDTAVSQPDSEPWHNLAGNSKYVPQIPGKIVRARQARVVAGTGYLHDWQAINVPDEARISQRHVITGFEFLE